VVILPKSGVPVVFVPPSVEVELKDVVDEPILRVVEISKVEAELVLMYWPILLWDWEGAEIAVEAGEEDDGDGEGEGEALDWVVMD
jgi:hypothetical protein